jgi:hypothetical protein
VTRDRARSQSGGQQTTGVTLEDQQGVIHMLVITTVEETELLLTVGWIVRGIDIEQDLSPLANLFSADFHKPIEQSILQLEEVARRGRVLPAAKSGL